MLSPAGSTLPRNSRLSPSGRLIVRRFRSSTPWKIPPMPTGHDIGATSSASASATSSSVSNTLRPSRSTLFTKVMIGTERIRQTSNSFLVCGSIPLAASITMIAESTAVSVR